MTSPAHESVESTELVLKDGRALPDLDTAEQQLDVLKDDGNLNALKEIAHPAAAYQEYEIRSKAQERANHFGRIKVMAEARIGSIDLDLHPYPRGSNLAFDGWVVPTGLRGHWRILGEGLRSGSLAAAMDKVERDSDIVSSWYVSRELRESGVLWVKAKPLVDRFRALRQSNGLTVQVLADRSGLPIAPIRNWLTLQAKPHQTIVRRTVALRVAEVLGVNPAKLEPARSPKSQIPKRRRLPKARQLPGGRLDRTYALIRKALQELDAAAGEEGKWGTAAAYHHLYEAEDIIGRALRRAV